MTDPETGFTLRQQQVLDAPIERVFAALTEPADLARWWGPQRFTAPEIQLDLRPGGRYRFTMQPPEGEAFHLSGEFQEIRRPTRLAFTFRWDEPGPDDRETLVVLSLEEAGGATTVSLSQGAFATAERLELHRAGWADSFAKLASVVRGDTQDAMTSRLPRPPA